jgi:transcriptional regulator with XRE-family HTH domain
VTENELHAIFSTNIKKHRCALYWSQVQLAKKIGLSVNFINDLESGKKWASPATMLKLANVFKIEAYELLKPPDTMPDSLGSLIKKYTDTIHAALEETRQAFLQEAKNKPDTGVDKH